MLSEATVLASQHAELEYNSPKHDGRVVLAATRG